MRSIRAAALLAAVGFIAGLAAVAPGRAASFDCGQASAPDEIAVCASQRLSNADVRMVTLYETALKLVGMGVRGDLQDQQRAFLAARATCGSDQACIAALYAQRVAALQKVIDDIAARGPY